MKEVRQRHMLYVFTHVWNLKYKTNEYNKTESLTDVEIKQMVTSGKKEERRGKIGVGAKKHKLLCIK